MESRTKDQFHETEMARRGERLRLLERVLGMAAFAVVALTVMVAAGTFPSITLSRSIVVPAIVLLVTLAIAVTQADAAHNLLRRKTEACQRLRHLARTTDAPSADIALRVRFVRSAETEAEILVAESVALGASASQPAELEKLIKSASVFVDVARWRTTLEELERRVCRVEVDTVGGVGFGTGFLVGRDLLLTNHHVVAPVIAGTAAPSSVVLRFDFKEGGDGRASRGTEHRLAELWLVDASEPSPVDLEPDPKSREAATDELDYALLRLAGAPGDEAFESGSKGASRRGWIRLEESSAVLASSPLLILQHPGGAPLKLAIDQVLSVNEEGTRVRYATATLGGSSGSPCFDSSFRLVALHHAGGPGAQSAYNEGIPIAAILALLKRRDKRAALRSESSMEGRQ